jgi:two-component system, NtrC family, nitrogen regulation response regulator NtrX
MDPKKTAILVADDDPALCEILVHILKVEGYSVERVHTGGEALRCLQRGGTDLVLLDLRLPDMSGMDILSALQKRKSKIQAIMISGEGDIRTALGATRMGAFDFLEKPLDPDRVLLTIKNALERRRLEDDKERLLEAVRGHYVMIGRSAGMQRVRDLIVKASKTNSKVLIEGENGTGKELVARAIHHGGAKAVRPFVAVNCAAIPDPLIESELFGHKKGAFTGAISDKSGKFKAADGGTLFLDEIGDMSPMIQAKMLRTLEEGAVEMLGSNEPVPVDVRLVSATNKDLQTEMAEGRFRKDLYFRINVLNIKLPPLRERRDDIPMLVEHYIRHFCGEHGVVLKRMTASAAEMLCAFGWPGNIRELKNFVEKMVILLEPDEIRADDIRPLLNDAGRSDRSEPNDGLKLGEAKDRFEREFIREKLEAANWNITRTAELLGIPRTYLHKKVKQMGLRSKR